MTCWRGSITVVAIAILMLFGGYSDGEFAIHHAAFGSDEVAGKIESEADAVTGKNNHIDYVEFAAEQFGGVKKFYNEAFGWTFEDWGPDYVAFSGAGIEGGFRGGEKPVNGSALVILYADDLEKTEASVVAAGGKITERHDFPGGRRFHFEDPAGNVLGVWTKSEGNDD